MFSKARQLLINTGRVNPGRDDARCLKLNPNLNLVLVLVLIILPMSGVSVFA